MNPEFDMPDIETMLPSEIRANLLELRKKALAESMRSGLGADAFKLPDMPQGQMVSGHYVAPSIFQHVAAAIQPLLENASKRANIQEAYDTFKRENRELYRQRKGEVDRWFGQLLGRPASQTDSAGFGPTPPEGLSIAPQGADRTRILKEGVNLGGAEGELSRRMLIEELVNGPAKQEQRDFQQGELRARLAETAANREATSAYREAEQKRQDARDAADRELRRELGGQADATRRLAISNAVDKAEAKSEAAKAAKAQDSQEMLNLLGTARELVPKATSSGLGAARDAAYGIFGQSTDAGDAAARLKTIGGMLVSKVPRMQGPQSDKDVILYREMAGRVGDPTVPVSQRLAAIDTLEEIHRRYAGLPPLKEGGATGEWAAPTSKGLPKGWSVK